MTGIELIAAERQGQVEREGYTPEHDDAHANRELLAAAICYAHNAGQFKQGPPTMWPFGNPDWKPGDNIKDLAKAGALIAAEIDRLQRKASL